MRWLRGTFVCKIAFSLAIRFGLGVGLAASGTPSEEATFTLQLLFTIFVDCLIFVLHDVRKKEIRKSGF